MSTSNSSNGANIDASSTAVLLEELTNIFPGNDYDVLQLIHAIWKYQEKPAVLSHFLELSKMFLDEKKFYMQLEFYFPQLMHMIIHFSNEITVELLESFILAICRVSCQAAFEFTFALLAALEDYQPEDAQGKRNASANHGIFLKCARLIQAIESVVVYGVRREFDSSELSKLIDDVTPTKEIESDDKGKPENSMEGTLYYKRITRRNSCSTKGWKQRYFKIDQRVLFCYRDAKMTTLKRAVTLEDAIVQSASHPKHGNYFEIYSAINHVKYQLYSEDNSTMLRWIHVLTRYFKMFL
jgi:hypothetical protein